MMPSGERYRPGNLFRRAQAAGLVTKRKMPLLRDEAAADEATMTAVREAEKRGVPHIFRAAKICDHPDVPCSQFAASLIPKKVTLRTDAPPAPPAHTEVVKLMPRTMYIHAAPAILDTEENYKPSTSTNALMNVIAEVRGGQGAHPEGCTTVVPGFPFNGSTIETIETCEMIGESEGVEVQVLDEEPDYEGNQWDEPDEFDRKCKSCGIVLPQLEMLEHVRGFHKTCTQSRGFPSRPTGHLLCPYPHCKVLLYNYEYLVAHLVGYHNQQQYGRTEVRMSNATEYEIWRAKHEDVNGKLLEDSVNFCDEDGNVLKSATILYCERNTEWYRMNEDNSARLPVVACPSQLQVEQMEDGSILLSGVLCHLGHKKALPLHLAPKGVSKPPIFDEQYKKYRCAPCRRFFADEITLQYHQRLRHGVMAMIGSGSRRPNIMCAECDASFENMVAYVSHVNELHLALEEREGIRTFFFETVLDFEVPL